MDALVRQAHGYKDPRSQINCTHLQGIVYMVVDGALELGNKLLLARLLSSIFVLGQHGLCLAVVL